MLRRRIWPEPDEVATGEDVSEEHDSGLEKPSKGFIGRYWMLMLGIGFVLAGTLSVILLRTNFMQVYLLGIDEPYTGLGRLETPTQGANAAIFAVGLVLIFVWGMRAEVPSPKDEQEAEEVDDGPIQAFEGDAFPESAVGSSAEPAVEEVPAQVPPAEFGYEHLPAASLSPIVKIKHITKVYTQGKISEGLYEKTLAMYEAELTARSAKKGERTEAAEEAPAPEKATEPSGPLQDADAVQPEEFGHEHLPPAHMSPDDKIDHLTRAYADGKISKSIYERDLARFEEQLKREQMHMPPPHLGARDKLDHLEDAYRMGRISKGTYEKNFVTFNAALLAEKASAEPEQPPEVIAPERTTISQAEEDKTMLQLDSLLDEIEQGNDTPEMREKLRKKKEESFEERILKEIEDLEDL